MPQFIPNAAEHVGTLKAALDKALEEHRADHAEHPYRARYELSTAHPLIAHIHVEYKKKGYRLHVELK